jgi:hypothetical protein
VIDGFDLPAELAVGVRGAAGALRFLRRFAAAYTRPLVTADGCSEEELRAAEVRLGFPLPDSLREVYQLVGNRDDLTRVQDVLLTPAGLRVDESGEVLVFRVENQNVAQWGVPLRLASEPDPPVVFRVGSRPVEERAWRPFLDRLSLEAVEMVLSEWMLSDDSLYGIRELDEEAISALENRFSRLPMPEYPLWAEPDGPPTRWFHGGDTVLRHDAGAWLVVRATSPERLAAVRRALPGEWMDV